MSRIKSNVLAFSDRAEGIRKARVDGALAQKGKEARFREVATGKQRRSEDLTEDELIAGALSLSDCADSFHKILHFWKRLAAKRERQLKVANQKIAQLEKRLARNGIRTA